MPLILLLETSTDVCSVALSKDGEIISTAESLESNSHTEKLTLLIKQCMEESGYHYKQLDAVALGSGPGSYTSLRIGAATAKGICYALNIPLIALDSLEILAYGLIDIKMNPNDIILPMIDARRMEVYTASYDSMMMLIEEKRALILEHNSFQKYPQIKHICGNGAYKFITSFPDDQIQLHHQNTSATFMNLIACSAYKTNGFADVAYFVPTYFKEPNITKSSKNLF